MSLMEKGEQLCARGRSTVKFVEDVYPFCREGPDFAAEAAQAFTGALRIYPSPTELIMILQSTVPEPIFKVCSFLFSPSPLN